VNNNRKPNITYLLGAGASYNAIPIVDEFPACYDYLSDAYLKLLSDKLSTVEESAAIIYALSEKFSEFNKLIKNTEQFSSIDTYAKMLSLNGNSNELHKYKSLLNTFFLLWQSNYFIKPKNRSLINNFNWDFIDRRFISLFANFLVNKNGKVIMPENLKLITWNYDFQIELALQKMSNKKISLINILNEFKCYPSINKSVKNPSVVHLNGISGLAKFEFESNDTLHNHYNLLENSNEKDFFLDIIQFFNTEKDYNFFDTLSFAWESNDNPITKESLNHAKSIMSQTDYLVIIGYSFPLFNREIDIDVFSKLKQHSIVYYQDINADINYLNEITGISKNRIKIVNDVKNFVIPFEYYKPAKKDFTDYL
jgi:hypothetical protein